MTPNQYKGFFSIPLPSTSNPIRRFQVFDISIGDDFFALSYNVKPFRDNSYSCYYLAVFNLDSQQSTFYHSVLPLTQYNYTRFLKMNQFGKENDTLTFVTGDHQLVGVSLVEPFLELDQIPPNTQFSQAIPGTDQEVMLRVTDINDKSIYFGNPQMVLDKIGGRAIFFLDEAFIGPDLGFNVTFEDPRVQYEIYKSEPISLSWAKLNTSYQYFQFKMVLSDVSDYLRLIQKTVQGELVINFARVNQSSRYSIGGISFFNQTITPKKINVSDYYYLLGYDIIVRPDLGPGIVGFHYNTYLNESSSEPKFTALIGHIIGSYCWNVQIASNQPNHLSVACLNQSHVFNLTFHISPIFNLARKAIINATSLSLRHFNPLQVYLHPAYPYTLFVLTTREVLIINQSAAFDITSPEYETKRIFLNTTSNEDTIIVQPFENALLILFAKKNMILHYDISDMKNIYLRRCLDLYNYNISVLASSSISKGTVYSQATNLLYIVAEEYSKNTSASFVVLCINPRDANGYIVKIIPIPPPKNNLWNISLGVTAIPTENLGDILMIYNGETYYSWKIYDSPFMVFSPQHEYQNTVNQVVNLNFSVYNNWSRINQPFTISLFEDEKTLYFVDKSDSNQNFNISVPSNVSEYTFIPTNLVQGSLFQVSVSNQKGLPQVKLTPFVEFRGVISLSNNIPSNETILSVKMMPKYIYILSTTSLYILSAEDQEHYATVSLPKLHGVFCNDIYIEPLEKIGTVLCNILVTELLYTFSIPNAINKRNNTELNCNALVNDLLDLRIDSKHNLLFYITENSQDSTLVYVLKIDPITSCLNESTFFEIPSWVYFSNNLHPAAFELAIFNASRYPNVYIIGVIDSNYGLRVVNFDRTSFTYQMIYELTFRQLYGGFLNLPTDIDIVQMKIYDYKCHSEECEGKILFVSSNFHSCIIGINITNAGFTLNQTLNKTCFLVPRDYEIFDSQVNERFLILIGKNRTAANPSIDLLIYNNTLGSMNYKNNLNQSDETLYVTPVWVYSLLQEPRKILNKVPILPKPFVTLEEASNNSTGSASNKIYFANYLNQSVSVFDLKEELKVDWEKPNVLKNNQISVIFANNQGDLILDIVIDDDSLNILKSTFVISLLVILGIIGGLTCLICFFDSRLKARRVIFSRKQQSDPLQKILVDLSSNYKELKSVLE